MKRLVLIALMVVGLTMGLSALIAPPHAFADAKADICTGVGAAGGACGKGGEQINKIVAAVINILSILVGIVSVIMMIYGGFRYVTSGGDSSAITSAKHTIIYALVGLLIVAMAQAIVQFVLDKI